MDKSRRHNIIKFIGTKFPKYKILTNEKGWTKLPIEDGWRNAEGEKEGKWRDRTKFGDLDAEGNYENGKREGVWVEYDDFGNVISKGQYINNKKEGGWIYFDSEGNMEAEGDYHNDKQNGKWVYKFPEDFGLSTHTLNGITGEEGYFVDGLRHGKWVRYGQRYGESGKVIITYNRGDATDFSFS